MLTHIHRDFVDEAFRYIKIIHALHGDSDVGYLFVYLLLRILERLIAEYHLRIALVRFKVRKAVSCDVPSEPLSEIEDSELSPKVHKTVAGRSTGKSHDALDERSYFQKCFEAFCPIGLEG